MKKTFLPLIMGILLLFASSATHATVKYVKANATGLNNGNSWVDAYTDLQSALIGSNDTVWVANGVYKPTATTNRAISFNISGRKLYGGFSGNEANLNDRNYNTFQTILSGDIGVVGDSTDNSQSVLFMNPNGVVTSANNNVGVVDGFEIRDGHRDSEYPGSNGFSCGGGLLIYNSGFPVYSPYAFVINCNFKNNYAKSGGAIGVELCHVQIYNCQFENNVAENNGGVIYAWYGTSSGLGYVAISDSKITNNKAVRGGAFYVSSRVSLSLNRCVMSANIADTGGVFYSPFHSGASLYVLNSLMVGNVANQNSVIEMGDVSNIGLTPYVSLNYSTIANNKAISNGCLSLGSYDVSSDIKGCIIWGNTNGSQSASNQLSTGNNSTRSYNIIQNGTFTAGNTFNFDPQFVNSGNAANAPFSASSYNYRLQPNSPAIDTSLTIPSYLNDLTNYARGAIGPWDLGCYYHCTTPPYPSINGLNHICNGASATLTAPSGGTSYIWNTADTTSSITVNTSGLYTVTIKDTNGCQQSLQHQLGVSSQIHINNSPILCPNSSKQLEVYYIGSCIWNNNDTFHSISAIDTGIYYVAGTDIYGCFSSDTIHLVPPPQQAYVSISGDSVNCTGDSVTLTAIGNILYCHWNNSIFVMQSNTVINSGTYYVYGTDSYGCVASDTFHLQQGTASNLSIFGDSLICPGGSATLTVTGNGLNYLWGNLATSQSITISDSGTYYVIGSDNIGCTASDTFHVQMGALPVPSITQMGNTFSTTMAFTSYQWYKDNVAIAGATQQQYTATQSGSYSVKVTNTNGCEGTSNTLSYTPTGINGVNKNSNLNIYPNPANKYAIIDLENLSDKINSYSIVDIWGRVIESRSNGIPNSQTLKIDLQNIAAGSYYIKLQGVKQQYSLKLAIVK